MSPLLGEKPQNHPSTEQNTSVCALSNAAGKYTTVTRGEHSINKDITVSLLINLPIFVDLRISRDGSF